MFSPSFFKLKHRPREGPSYVRGRAGARRQVSLDFSILPLWVSVAPRGCSAGCTVGAGGSWLVVCCATGTWAVEAASPAEQTWSEGEMSVGGAGRRQPCFGVPLRSAVCISACQSSVLKGVTIPCLVSCHYRERKAPLMALRTARADTHPREDIHILRRADNSRFQELCALISEPALLPLNKAIPQAKPPVLKAILLP